MKQIHKVLVVVLVLVPLVLSFHDRRRLRSQKNFQLMQANRLESPVVRRNKFGVNNQLVLRRRMNDAEAQDEETVTQDGHKRKPYQNITLITKSVSTQQILFQKAPKGNNIEKDVINKKQKNVQEAPPSKELESSNGLGSPNHIENFTVMEFPEELVDDEDPKSENVKLILQKNALSDEGEDQDYERKRSRTLPQEVKSASKQLLEDVKTILKHVMKNKVVQKKVKYLAQKKVKANANYNLYKNSVNKELQEAKVLSDEMESTDNVQLDKPKYRNQVEKICKEALRLKETPPILKTKLRLILNHMQLIEVKAKKFFQKTIENPETPEKVRNILEKLKNDELLKQFGRIAHLDRMQI